MTGLTTQIVKHLVKQGRPIELIAQDFGVCAETVRDHLNKPDPPPTPPRNYNAMVDWPLYTEGMIQRGVVTLDMRPLQAWYEQLRLMNQAKPGRRYQYPQVLIDFLMQLKCFFKIDYRSLEGIARSLLAQLPYGAQAPDYTTLWYRFGRSRPQLAAHQSLGPQEIAGDASGLKTTNRGEYRHHLYGGRPKEFIKLHLAVNTQTDQVVACTVTTGHVHDQTQAESLIRQAQRYGPIERGLFDGAYDSYANYRLLPQAVIRPKQLMAWTQVIKTIARCEQRLAVVTDPERRAGIMATLSRLRTVQEYRSDYHNWREENRYGQRWKVEGRYSVFKRIFGEGVFSKKLDRQEKEVILKVNLMNRFTSLTIGALNFSSGGAKMTPN